MNQAADPTHQGPLELLEILQSTVDRIQHLLQVSACLIQVFDSTLSSESEPVVRWAAVPQQSADWIAEVMRFSLRLYAAEQDHLRQSQTTVLFESQVALQSWIGDDPDSSQFKAIASTIHTLLMVPLYHQRLWGSLILIQCDQPWQGSDKEQALLETIAAQAALIVAQSEARSQQIQSLTTSLAYQQSLADAYHATLLDGVLITDSAGLIQQCNPRFIQLWHLPDPIAAPSSVDLLTYLTPHLQQPEKFAERVAYFNQYPAQYGHDRLVLQDGRILDCCSGPIGTVTPHCYGRIWFWRDVSRSEWAEDEIRQTLTQKQWFDTLQQRLVSVLSHEFRTPLSTILSSVELLEHYSHRWTAARKQRHFKRIQAAVHHMSLLLDDIVLLEQQQTQCLSFNPAPLDLEQFCRHQVVELQHSANRPVAIQLETHGVPIPMQADEQLLRYILTNLISNAIKYSPQQETVWVELRFEPPVVVLQVRDRGIGIPPGDQPTIFSLFYRGSNVGPISGTGLGLAIVQQCVQLHGGTINVVSTEQQGTTFTVTLPIEAPGDAVRETRWG